MPIAAPITQPITAEPSAPESTPSAGQLTPILRREKRTIAMSDSSDCNTSAVKRSKRQLKKQKKNSKL